MGSKDFLKKKKKINDTTPKLKMSTAKDTIKKMKWLGTAWEQIFEMICLIRAFQVELMVIVQLVKNPPAMQEIWVWSLGWEDPLEKGKATHSSILAKRWTRLSDFHLHFSFLHRTNSSLVWLLFLLFEPQGLPLVAHFAWAVPYLWDFTKAIIPTREVISISFNPTFI